MGWKQACLEALPQQQAESKETMDQVAEEGIMPKVETAEPHRQIQVQAVAEGSPAETGAIMHLLERDTEQEGHPVTEAEGVVATGPVRSHQVQMEPRAVS